MSGVVMRIGHVLGWTGNGIAALFLIAAIGIAGNSLWTIWHVNNLPIMYEVMTTDGVIWEVMTPDGSSSMLEVSDIVSKHEKGEAAPKGWIIYRQGAVPAEKMAAWQEAIRRFGSKGKDISRRNAWDQLRFFGTACLVLAILAYLLGRAFRYIFSGSGS